MTEVTEKVRELLESIVSEREYLIVDIHYRRGGGKFVLRILVDKKGGITLEECAKLNTELSELLDRENIIESSFILEVSSPGLDRKLQSDRDYIWAMGKKVRVTTFGPIEGKNAFVGELLGMNDDNIVINEGDISTEIPRNKIASAKLAPDFKWGKA